MPTLLIFLKYISSIGLVFINSIGAAAFLKSVMGGFSHNKVMVWRPYIWK